MQEMMEDDDNIVHILASLESNRSFKSVTSDHLAGYVPAFRTIAILFLF